MHPNPHPDVDSELALGLSVETGHLPGDLHTRLHCSARIVLMGGGVTENSEKSVALL
jgi:hypothetical protein